MWEAWKGTINNEKQRRNYIPSYPSGSSTTVPFNFLPRKYAVLLLPSSLTSGVQCLVLALTGPLCWMRQGSILTAQLGVLFSDFLMASMLFVVFYNGLVTRLRIDSLVRCVSDLNTVVLITRCTMFLIS